MCVLHHEGYFSIAVQTKSEKIFGYSSKVSEKHLFLKGYCFIIIFVL